MPSEDALHLEKHGMEQTAVKAALAAEERRLFDHATSHAAAHASHESIHDVTARAHHDQHAAEQRAVEAAVKAMDRRLDSMNEFRDQLRDQAATFIRREQLESFIGQYERAHDEVLALIQTEREERRKNESDHALIHSGSEGVKKGMSQTTGIIVAAIGVVGTVLGIIIVISNVLITVP